MGKPDNDEIEREAGAQAILNAYGNVIGEWQARNIAYVVLTAARVAKFDAEKKSGAPEISQPWDGTLTRIEAIKILDRATDKDGPHWEFVVQDWYDESADNMPSIMDVFAALGVTEAEFREATDQQFSRCRR